MNRFFAAIRFLTIIPLPGTGGTDAAALAGSIPFFPVVGLLIGTLAALSAWGLGHLLPPWPVSVVLVLVLISLSGGLHLDGLSDTADGFLSSRTRERMLEIMKDSHVGVMGVIAVVGVMSLKMASLASLPKETVWRAVFLMPICGRCMIMAMMSLLPYAKPEGGLGKLFWEKRSKWNLLWGVFFMVILAGLVAKTAGLIIVGITIGLGLLFARSCMRKIGGATGDTLGAVCELCEIVPALTLTAIPADWMM
jgi:adenosylcobinamide-GDP ribazoletransferase